MKVDCSLSIIITTKNRKLFLMRALKSVFSQSLPPMEIIVIDDGSNSEHLLLDSDFDVFSDSINIIYKKNGTSKGGNYSRNLGIKISSGSIVMFLDDDDFWCENKIKTQVDIFEADKNQEIGLVYTGKQFVNSSNLSKVIRKSQESNNEKSIWDGNYPGSTSSVALRKNVLDKSGMFDEELKSLQDYDLWIRVINESKACWDGEYNLLYTLHDDSGKQISTDVGKHIESINHLKNKYKSDIDNLSFIKKRKFISRTEHVISRAYRKNHDLRFFSHYFKSLYYYPALRTLILPFYFK